MPRDVKIPNLDVLYEQAACGLLLTNAAGLIVHANQTFCRWLGYDLAQLIEQRRIQDLLNVGGRIFHQTHIAPLLKMQGSVAEVKLELLHQDGHTVPMMLNASSNADESGAVFHQIAVFIASDRHKYERELVSAKNTAEELLRKQIEAQRELTIAEARFRIAVEAAELHVWQIDPENGTRLFDDSVAKLIGLPHSQPISDDQYNDAIESDDRKRERQALITALRPDAGIYRNVYRTNGMDGIQRTILETGRGIFDTDGKLVKFVGILQDISEQTQQRAAAEDRAILAEQMVGIVSHDLRNPLSVIINGTEMLQRQTLLEGQERIVGRIKRSGERAHRLISDLLDFTMARLGSGLTVTNKLIDLHDAIADFVDELSHSFPDNVVKHRRAGEGQCQLDPDRLFQLIGNLVANAVAYGTPSGLITIVSTIDPDNFSVSVHNDGPPIPDELLPTLFEPMTRGDQITGDIKSVGLGLFIVQQIAKAHQGALTVSSNLEDGTTFSFIAPRY
jgi:sigma-B regulation protein RsbU (phosphoserine phosphatase)